MSKATSHIASIYNAGMIPDDDPNKRWVRRHWAIIDYAGKNGIAIGGSVGMAIGHGSPVRAPNDLDFVTTDHNKAISFVLMCLNALSGYRSRCQIRMNNMTSWVPDGALAHYRIDSSMWLPICIFVVENMSVWYPCKNLCVQSYNEIVAAAKKLTERDDKPRIDDDQPETEDDLPRREVTPEPEEDEEEPEDIMEYEPRDLLPRNAFDPFDQEQEPYPRRRK